MPQSGETDVWETSLCDSSFPSLLSQESPAEWLNSCSTEEGYNAILGSVALSYGALTMGQALYLHSTLTLRWIHTLSILTFGEK